MTRRYTVEAGPGRRRPSRRPRRARASSSQRKRPAFRACRLHGGILQPAREPSPVSADARPRGQVAGTDRALSDRQPEGEAWPSSSRSRSRSRPWCSAGASRAGATACSAKRKSRLGAARESVRAALRPGCRGEQRSSDLRRPDLSPARGGRDGRAVRRALLPQRAQRRHDRVRRLEPVRAAEVLPHARADAHPRRPLLRRPAREGGLRRLPRQAAARQEARAADPEPLPAELRRQPQRVADVHARRTDDQRRRRHASLHAGRGQPGVARRRRDRARQAAEEERGRLHAQVLRHPGRVPRGARQARRGRAAATTCAASSRATPPWTCTPTPPRA